MKMYKSVVFTILVSLMTQFVAAQNISKTGVVRMSLRSSGPIVQNEQVKGYYFFYNLEKKDKKNNNYLLSVYDENLREINSVNIVRPTNYVLADGSFNGEAFAFLFYDSRNKTLELVSYDQTLKEAGTAKKVVKSRLAQASFTSIMNGVAPSQPFLLPVSNKGFLYYGIKEGDKYQYEISYYDNAMKLNWSKQAGANASDVEMANEGFQSEQFIGSLITRQKKASSKDIQTELMVQNASDGNILFQVPMETAQYSVSYSDVAFDEEKQNFVVFGEYYDKKEKEAKAQSLGFIYLTLDMSGKIIGEKLNSWQTEISRVTPINEKGKFEGSNAWILVHDIIRTADGQIFVVGEQYKKVASGAGIAGQILSVAAAAATGYYGSSSASVQLNIYNMVIFQFNPDYSINKVHMFEKDKNVVMLPSGSTYYSSKMLSYYAKAVGGFDYVFSQESGDKSTFAVTYINYDREKGEKGKNLLGTIVYTPEKVFSVDKMSLNRKSTEYFVYKAKEGYVLITEYFKKEKRVDSRLEKINY